MNPLLQMGPNPMYEQAARIRGRQLAQAGPSGPPKGLQQGSQPQPEADGDGPTVPASDRVRAGGCLCGAVRFKVVGEPVRTGICHCTDCRRTSGSAFSYYAIWPRSAYSGAGEIVQYADRGFCPKCGSRVVYLSGDSAEVMIGSLDEAPSDLAPGYELWTPRRESWLRELPWARQFQADRVDPT